MEDIKNQLQLTLRDIDKKDIENIIRLEIKREFLDNWGNWEEIKVESIISDKEKREKKRHQIFNWKYFIASLREVKFCNILRPVFEIPLPVAVGVAKNVGVP